MDLYVYRRIRCRTCGKKFEGYQWTNTRMECQSCKVKRGKKKQAPKLGKVMI